MTARVPTASEPKFGRPTSTRRTPVCGTGLQPIVHY